MKLQCTIVLKPLYKPFTPSLLTIILYPYFKVKYCFVFETIFVHIVSNGYNNISAAKLPNALNNATLSFIFFNF